MEQQEIIKKIIKNEPSYRSKKLLSWVNESEENWDEFIRYKNTQALLHQGKEMSEKFVAKNFKRVKRKMDPSGCLVEFRQLLKNAVVITLAIIGEYLLHSVTPMIGEQVVSMNKISVPNGNRSLIVLPDGSKAWLTNGSKISYPEIFTKKTRDIKKSLSCDEKDPLLVTTCRLFSSAKGATQGYAHLLQTLAFIVINQE